MHWFTKEFHPRAWVRQAASKLCKIDAGAVVNLMRHCATMLRNNQTTSSDCVAAFKALRPEIYDGRDPTLINICTAATSYHCIRKYHEKDGALGAMVGLDGLPVPNLDTDACLRSTTDVDQELTPLLDALSPTQQLLTPAELLACIATNDPAKYVARFSCPGYQNTQYFDGQEMKSMDGNVQQTILTHPWTGKIPGYVDAVSHHNQLPFKEGQEREFYKNLHDGSLNMEANMSADYCEHYPEEAMKHLLLIFTSRFFKDSSRFMHNGQGNLIRTAAGYAYNGCHLMHGPGTVSYTHLTLPTKA